MPIGIPKIQKILRVPHYEFPDFASFSQSEMNFEPYEEIDFPDQVENGLEGHEHQLINEHENNQPLVQREPWSQ